MGGTYRWGTTPLDYVDDTLVIKPTMNFVYTGKPFVFFNYNIPAFTISTGLQGNMSVPAVGAPVQDSSVFMPFVLDY